MGYLIVLAIGLCWVAILVWQHATWQGALVILLAFAWATWRSFRNLNRTETELPNGNPDDPYDQWWKS